MEYHPLMHLYPVKWVLFFCAVIYGLNLFGQDWPLPDPYDADFITDNDIASISFLLRKDTLKHVQFDNQLNVLHEMTSDSETRRKYENGILRHVSVHRTNGSFRIDSLRSDGTASFQVSSDGVNETLKTFYPDGKLWFTETIGGDGACSYHSYGSAEQAEYSVYVQKDGSTQSAENHVEGETTEHWNFTSNALGDTILIERKIDNWPVLRLDSAAQNYMITVGSPFKYKQYKWRADSSYHDFHEVNDSVDFRIVHHEDGRVHTISRLQRGKSEWSLDKLVDGEGELLRLDSSLVTEMPNYRQQVLFHYKFNPGYADKAWQIQKYNEEGHLVSEEHLNLDLRPTYFIRNTYWARGPKKGQLRKRVSLYNGSRKRDRFNPLIPFHRLKFWRKPIKLDTIEIPGHQHYGGCIVHDDPWPQVHTEVRVEVDALQADWHLGYDELLSDYVILSTDSTKVTLADFSRELASNIQYSRMVIEAGIQGLTVVGLLTDENDRITGFQPLKEAHPLVTEPVIKALSSRIGHRVEWPDKEEIKVRYTTFKGASRTTTFPFEKKLAVLVRLRLI